MPINNPTGGSGGVPSAHASSHLPAGTDEIDWDGTIHQAGTLAARPAAAPANAGSLYAASDNGNLYRSDGATWTLISSSGGGGSIVAAEAGATVVAAATTFNFTTGLDVADAGGGQANVSVDKSELGLAPADITGFDESAQDAVGAMAADTISLDLSYVDATPALSGTVLPAGLRIPVVTKSSDYTAVLTDDTILVTGDTTITLPTAVGNTGKQFTIKKVDATTNIATVTTTSSQTIDGESYYTLNDPYEGMKFISDGANWSIV